MTQYVINLSDSRSGHLNISVHRQWVVSQCVQRWRVHSFLGYFQHGCSRNMRYDDNTYCNVHIHVGEYFGTVPV